MQRMFEFLIERERPLFCYLCARDSHDYEFDMLFLLNNQSSDDSIKFNRFKAFLMLT